MLTYTDRSALLDSVRSGDLASLLAWADSFEEDGQIEYASAIREFPRLATSIREAAKDPGVPQDELSDEYPNEWWMCVEFKRAQHTCVLHSVDPFENAPPSKTVAECQAIATVLDNWNDLNAAIEWLALDLGIRFIDIESSSPEPEIDVIPHDDRENTMTDMHYRHLPSSRDATTTEVVKLMIRSYDNFTKWIASQQQK